MKAACRTLSDLLGEVLVIAVVPGALALAFAARPETSGSADRRPSAPSLAEAEQFIAEAAARRERLWNPAPPAPPADPRIRPAVLADVDTPGVPRAATPTRTEDVPVPARMTIHSVE